eukprot:5442833-Prymnesium_polylepis.2
MLPAAIIACSFVILAALFQLFQPRIQLFQPRTAGAHTRAQPCALHRRFVITAVTLHLHKALRGSPRELHAARAPRRDGGRGFRIDVMFSAAKRTDETPRVVRL